MSNRFPELIPTFVICAILEPKRLEGMWMTLKILRAHPKALNDPLLKLEDILYYIYIALFSKQLTLKR